MKRVWIVLLLCLSGNIAVPAQGVYTPEKGSPERKAILDALRVPIERELKQKIVFAADNFNVQGNWAFVSGTPQTPNGDRPNYQITKYRGALDAGAFDNSFYALLKRSGGTWRVTIYMIGCTDVCFMDWPRKYRAPKVIFPLD